MVPSLTPPSPLPQLLAAAIVLFRTLGLYMITNRVADASAMGTIADSATDLGGKKSKAAGDQKAPKAAEIAPSSDNNADVSLKVTEAEQEGDQRKGAAGDEEATVTLLAVREREEISLEFKNMSL